MDTADISDQVGETAEERAPRMKAQWRAESIHRLQVGLIGLGAMLLLVGLANVIMDRARESDAAAVPDAAATIAAPEATEAPQDPLADTGVVPEVAPSEEPLSQTGQPGTLQGQPLSAEATEATDTQ